MALLYEEESEKIIGAMMEVHKTLGNGFLEAVYQEALELEFILQKIPYEREKSLPIYYKGHLLKKNYNVDFVCYGKILVELKAVSVLIGEHESQLLNYLTASKYKLGFLANFGETRLRFKRFIH
jgi:GxxExxY protein